MVNCVSVFILGLVVNGATPQTVEYITTRPVIMQNPTTPTVPCNSWEELMPTLRMIKNAPGIKKERLLNVVKIIKFLLSDDVEKNQCDKILEEIKETNDAQCTELPDIDSIVDDKLKPIKEALENNNCTPEDAKFKNEIPKNNTADYSKILAKISAALAKVKENNEKQKASIPSAVMPIFRSKKNGCKDMKQRLVNAAQAAGNTVFNIPCQRAVDILDETATFEIPKQAYCDLPANMKLKSILKNSKLNADSLPNSVSCMDAEDSVAIIFKPKKISMMQVYGNLLKKITITVLVPYYVSKLVV